MKKANFNLLTQPTGLGVCGHNICYYVAAFVNLFNLICSMSIDEKVES